MKADAQLQQQFAQYIIEHIGRPSTWDEAILGQFDPKLTQYRLNRFIIHLLSHHRSGALYDSIHSFYGFNGSITTLEAQELHVKESSRMKAVENFLRGKTVPQLPTLEFVACLFELPCISLSDFEAYKAALPVQEQESQLSLSPAVPRRFITWFSARQIAAYTACLLLVLVLLFRFHFLQTELQTAQAQLRQIDERAFVPRYALTGLVENIEASQLPAEGLVWPSPVREGQSPLVFYTNNIYNSSFLHSSKAWGFPTDPKGEDMNSEYGEPYRKDIMPLLPADIHGTTLANGEMWIRFNLQNTLPQSLFIDNLSLKIIQYYPIDKQAARFNTWLPKSSEKQYELSLNRFALTYPIATLVEIGNGQSKHFSLKIKNRVAPF